MKVFKFFIAIVLITSGVVAQNGKFSATLAYPLPLGDNNFEQHNGIVDIGVQYRFVNLTKLHLAGGINVGFYGHSNDAVNFSRNSTLIQPKLLAELKFLGVRPFAGLGYTFWNQTNELEGMEDIEFKWNGVSLNLGASIDILPKIFIIGQIDIIKLSGGEDLPDNDVFKNITVLKLGAGIRL